MFSSPLALKKKLAALNLSFNKVCFFLDPPYANQEDYERYLHWFSLLRDNDEDQYDLKDWQLSIEAGREMGRSTTVSSSTANPSREAVMKEMEFRLLEKYRFGAANLRYLKATESFIVSWQS